MEVIKKKRVSRAKRNGRKPGDPIGYDPSLVCKTFHPFNDLPIELREAVWALVIPNGPRIVTITNDGSREWDKKENEYYYHVEAKASYKISIFQSVTKESRRIACRGYSRAFGKQLLSKTKEGGENPIYFNFKKDILVVEDDSALVAIIGGLPTNFRPDQLSPLAGLQRSFNKHYQLNNTSPEDVSAMVEESFTKICNLAIASYWTSPFSGIQHLLPYFKNLKSLDIVASSRYLLDRMYDIVNKRAKLIHGPEFEMVKPLRRTNIQMGKLFLGLDPDVRQPRFELIEYGPDGERSTLHGYSSGGVFKMMPSMNK